MKTTRFECLLKAVYAMNWHLLAIVFVVDNDGGSTCGQFVCDVRQFTAIQSMLFSSLFRVRSNAPCSKRDTNDTTPAIACMQGNHCISLPPTKPAFCLSSLSLPFTLALTKTEQRRLSAVRGEKAIVPAICCCFSQPNAYRQVSALLKKTGPFSGDILSVFHT